MSFEHRCRPCGSSGYYYGDREDTCKICKGRGVIYVEGNRSDFQACRPCGGSGYYYGDRKDTCKVCGGLGIVTKAYAN